jgi:hypothetical protein
MRVYEVTYFCEDTGDVYMKLVKAASQLDAIEAVELMGEFEVIEATLQDVLA